METPSSRLQLSWLVVAIAALGLIGLALRSSSAANADPGSPGMAVLIVIAALGFAAVAAAAWSSVRTRYEPAVRFALLAATLSLCVAGLSLTGLHAYQIVGWGPGCDPMARSCVSPTWRDRLAVLLPPLLFLGCAGLSSVLAASSRAAHSRQYQLRDSAV